MLTLSTAVMMFGVMMPPAEFDRPYDGALIIEYVKPQDVSALCQGHSSIRPGQIVSACATRKDRSCYIVFPLDTGVHSRKRLDLLMRHEIAHCNGWEPHVRHTDR
jgi:hypothetical protein